MFDLSQQKLENKDININFNTKIDELSKLKENLTLDSNAINSASTQLSTNQDQLKTQIRLYENDEKKYKILQRYSNILQQAQNLLGIVPTNLESLSTEELCKSIEEIVSNRKKISNQTSFTFYQNLFTDTVNNVLQLEKDFQERKISPKEASGKLLEMQQTLKENETNMPEHLNNTYVLIKDLLKSYNACISSETANYSIKSSTPLKETDISSEHKEELLKLNDESNIILDRVSNLNSSLNDFKPQVNLNTLIDDLNNANNFLNSPNWDADEFSYTCTKLESTTLNLTNEQTEKNQQKEKLSIEIKNISSSCNELGSKSMVHTTAQVINQVNERSNNYIKSSNEIIDILEIDENFPIDVAIKVKNTLFAQLDEDISLKEKLSKNPELLAMVKVDLKNEEAAEKLIDLQQYINKLELELSTVNTLKYENEEDDKK